MQKQYEQLVCCHVFVHAALVWFLFLHMQTDFQLSRQLAAFDC
jgi:hypothetical protein